MSGFDPRAGIQPGEDNDPGELPVFEQEIDLNAEQLSQPGAMVPGDETYVLHADDLTAGYFPGVNILNSCSLTAKEGELVGIIGPNGAGKSTLLKAMFGLVRVHSGKVTLRGRDITNLRADALVKEGVGFVPQNNNVFPSLTIEENFQVGCFQNPKLFNQQFERVAAIFPTMADRRKQRAGSLSGGERQMVAMGRALMMDPSVLLLDEPSAGLSPALQDEVFVNVKGINAAGVTVVIVEQNAYTGTGAELANDPKVIELYLGTLAKA